MAKTNKEIVGCLENDAWVAAWDKGEDEIDAGRKVVRCKDCIHHEHKPYLDVFRQDELVYCIIYDTFKRCDGFCELGTGKEDWEEN